MLLVNNIPDNNSLENFDNKEKFVKDFVTVWTKIMNADRQEVKKFH